MQRELVCSDWLIDAWSRLVAEVYSWTTTHWHSSEDGDDSENETVIGEQSVKTKTRDEQVWGCRNRSGPEEKRCGRREVERILSVLHVRTGRMSAGAELWDSHSDDRQYTNNCVSASLQYTDWLFQTTRTTCVVSSNNASYTLRSNKRNYSTLFHNKGMFDDCVKICQCFLNSCRFINSTLLGKQ